MKTLSVTILATLLLALGCAGNYPAPTQAMADVQSADRSANELGAQNNPKAQLHLKLAEDQLKQAKTAMENDDNRAAERLLTRAKADAELAIALTREDQARVEEAKAVNQADAQRATNVAQGAVR
ncbi:MAG TPA: DUF4398 domain-containing protein [Polyangiales bacterium]